MKLPVPAKPAQPSTKQQFVYDLLRAAIMRCELVPGERLVIDELARRFQVSIIPVREALRLLQSEGLVVSVAHTGTTVAPISLASIHEVFALLEALEVVSTRTAAGRIGEPELAELATLVRAMDRALAANRPTRWADLNTAFHLTICRFAGMPLLEEMLRRAFENWDRLRRHYFDGVLVRRITQAQAEHHRLLSEIERRDFAALERTVRLHAQGALAAYSAFLDSTAERTAARRAAGAGRGAAITRLAARKSG